MYTSHIKPRLEIHKTADRKMADTTKNHRFSENSKLGTRCTSWGLFTDAAWSLFPPIGWWDWDEEIEQLILSWFWNSWFPRKRQEAEKSAQGLLFSCRVWILQWCGQSTHSAWGWTHSTNPRPLTSRELSSVTQPADWGSAPLSASAPLLFWD